ncbi:transcriptional regulator [Bacillus cereus]|nr:transcriptional regulator [Bacillus cereus]
MELTFRLARQRVGLSREGVADLVPCSPTTIAKYETDSSKISNDMAHQLADIYCISPYDLYYGQESEFIEKVKRDYHNSEC